MTSSPNGPTVPSAIQLEQFRTRTERQKIHPRESLLLWVVSAQLIVLPWTFGAMRIGAQTAGLVLGLLAFAIALLPRIYSSPAPDQPPFRLYTWPKLVRFPIFWLGLLLLALIVTQALNPAWEFLTNGKVWWISPLANIDWLPGGVRAPFDRWGPWRMLMIYGGAWTGVCAVWIGFTRRRTYQTFFTVLAANAFLLAALGIAQRALGATKIFWLWQPPLPYFVSAFTYKNHAGAYFNLLLGLCAGLALWHYERTARRLDKSGPSGIFAFFGTAVALIVTFSYSRTATILMAGFVVAILAIFIWRTFVRARPESRSPLMLFVVLAAFVTFGWITLTSLRTTRLVESMGRISREIDTMNGRTVVAAATWEMAQDRPVSGWGAGSFRFVFPQYQKRYPAAWAEHGRRLYWEHAHNDYLELLAEYGWMGAALGLLGLGYAGFQLLRRHFWENPLGLFVVLGCATTLAHCWLDFNFFNPAILTTWIVLLFGTLRWLELEERAGG